nr:hypothetical protein BN993_01113 [Virgibacillus halodenitrificans]
MDSLISTAGGRFPPAWLQPLPPLRYVQGLQLMLFEATEKVLHILGEVIESVFYLSEGKYEDFWGR